MKEQSKEAGTVPDNETILYRGASFELGHGPGYYGIWPAGTPRPPSIEWWPDTPEGWQGAWARYNALETPGTIVMTGQRPVRGVGPPAGGVPRRAAAARPGRGLIAVALLAAGVVSWPRRALPRLPIRGEPRAAVG